MQILCTGDVHLGRQLGPVAQRPDRQALGPAAAWHAFIAAALARQVDLVALTGDLVDESNKYYEAFSVLSAGVRRLLEAGIPVVAVAGNHDYDVLPRLARQLPGFHLLGRGGEWEHFACEQQGRAALHLVGWSFPARHVRHSPLDNYRAPADGLPTVGLLHCDCNAAGGVYAPVGLGALRAAGPQAWLLGHLHTPHVFCAAHPLVRYLGSLQGLHPGETGRHAALLLTVDPAGNIATEDLPLGPLRWEQLEVSVAGVSDEETLQAVLSGALRELHERAAPELVSTRLVGCRLRLTGRTALHRSLPGLLAAAQADLHPQFDQVEYVLESLEDLSRPALSLDALARSADPAGLLARRLLVLDSGEPEAEYRRLLEGGRRAVQEARALPQFAARVGAGAPEPDGQLRELLLQAGLRALEELLAQKEEAS